MAYLVVDRRRLGKQLDGDGPLAALAIEAIEHALAVGLPPRQSRLLSREDITVEAEEVLAKPGAFE